MAAISFGPTLGQYKRMRRTLRNDVADQDRSGHSTSVLSTDQVSKGNVTPMPPYCLSPS